LNLCQNKYVSLKKKKQSAEFVRERRIVSVSYTDTVWYLKTIPFSVLHIITRKNYEIFWNSVPQLPIAIHAISREAFFFSHISLSAEMTNRKIHF